MKKKFVSLALEPEVKAQLQEIMKKDGRPSLHNTIVRLLQEAMEARKNDNR